MIDETVEEAALVADPLVIDGHVLARHDAAKLMQTGIEPHVAALRAMGADRLGALQLPRSVAEAADAVGQRAHRAQIDDVAAGLGVHRLLRKEVNDRLAAAVEEAELRLVLPFFEVANTAPANDAAFLVEHDQVADGVALFLVSLDLLELGLSGTMLEGLILQRTLAALVTNRAIQRVVDENEFEGILARLRCCFAGIAEFHAVADTRRTGRDDHPATAHVLLNETHAACAQRFQLGMRTEDRYVNVRRRFGRIGQQRAGRYFVFDFVDGDGYEIRHWLSSRFKLRLQQVIKIVSVNSGLPKDCSDCSLWQILFVKRNHSAPPCFGMNENMMATLDTIQHEASSLQNAD